MRKFEHWVSDAIELTARLPLRWPDYARLMRLDQPIGILLLLYPTWWALLLAAKGWPSLWLALVFTLGGVLMRSAGCVINDLLDKDFDRRVTRTQYRPLVTGAVSVAEAKSVFLTLVMLAFLLVLTTNRLTIYLSAVALLLVASYPLAKRYTYLPQFHLGLAFGWSIPMAFAAVTDSVPQLAWLLLVANVLWSAVYDTCYAMADRDDDIRIGVKSTAILFAEYDRHIIGVLQGLLLLALVLIGQRAELQWQYYIGLILVIALMLYHQLLIAERHPADCITAFRHNQWIGFVVLIGILAGMP